MGLVAVGALVDGGVGVPQLDGDPPFQFLAVTGSPYTCERLNQGGLSVVDVAYGADVDLGLARKFWNLNSPLLTVKVVGGAAPINVYELLHEAARRPSIPKVLCLESLSPGPGESSRARQEAPPPPRI